jgi:thiol-disulfide isomerase/thioredoxin
MPRQLRPAAWLALAAVAALTLSACTGGTNAVSQGTGNYRYVGSTTRGKVIAAADRKTAGNISGPLLGGGQFNLEANAGKVTVLNFWASWCGPCQTESPQYDNVYRALKSSGVDFVGLDVKETSQNQPMSFIKTNDITYPNVYDPDGKTALQLGKLPAISVGLPWTVVIDKNLKVAAVYTGSQQPADLEPVLKSLAAENEPDASPS